MHEDLAQKAVGAALKDEWESAIQLNSQILKKNPKDIDALNRLAKAYAETGSLQEAKKTSKKVLDIDPFNSIAQKCLKKWDVKKIKTNNSKATSAKAFLEEPGKTKITKLVHLGSEKVLVSLDSGERLKLNIKNHRADITTQDGEYVGRLTDDLSARLRTLTKYGNEYDVLVKATEPEEITVFIREVKKSDKLADIPSFSGDKVDYISFAPPELIHKEGVDLGDLESED